MTSCVFSSCFFEVSTASIIILRAASLLLFCKLIRRCPGLRADEPKPKITVWGERGVSSTVESNMYTKCLATGAVERMCMSVRERQRDEEVGEDECQTHQHHCHRWWDCQSSAAPAQSFLPSAQLPSQACCWPQLCWSWTADSGELLRSVQPKLWPQECHLYPYKEAKTAKNVCLVFY